MVYSLILSVHVVLCALVILVVLIQSGKGAGLSGVFGGGGSDAVFSAPSGSSFIRKVTAGVAIAFFVSSLLLTYLGARRGARTVIREFPMPAAPAAQPESAQPPPPAEAPAPEKK